MPAPSEAAFSCELNRGDGPSALGAPSDADAAHSRFHGIESGRHDTGGGGDSFTPAMRTDIATFSRFPGSDDGRQRDAHGVRPRGRCD
eukprot:3249120-Pyramimonas_sp.AAC.1